MAASIPPIKNAAYTINVVLVSQANSLIFKANPTLASGDVKVSIDGGTFNNLNSLPTVSPSGGKQVVAVLTSGEMNGDIIGILFSDAAGDEWADLYYVLYTTARGIDDLAFPTTKGNSIDVTATGAVGVDWGNVENKTTTNALTGTT